MALDNLDSGKNDRRDKLIGVYIGILAVMLAICSMGGNNAQTDATHRNIEAANNWSFFQSKNLRRNELRLQIDEFELKLATDGTLSEEARQKISAKIAEYRATENRLTSEPDKKEGLDELFIKGKELEAQRDVAFKRGPYFDYGGALIQIAIVLASVAIISGGNLLLFASFILGALGAISTIGGFTLAFPLPF